MRQLLRHCLVRGLFGLALSSWLAGVSLAQSQPKPGQQGRFGTLSPAAQGQRQQGLGTSIRVLPSVSGGYLGNANNGLQNQNFQNPYNNQFNTNPFYSPYNFPATYNNYNPFWQTSPWQYQTSFSPYGMDPFQTQMWQMQNANPFLQYGQMMQYPQNNFFQPGFNNWWPYNNFGNNQAFWNNPWQQGAPIVGGGLGAFGGGLGGGVR